MRRFVIGRLLDDLELATVAEILGDPGRPERVAADPRMDPRVVRHAGNAAVQPTVRYGEPSDSVVHST